MAKDVNIQFSGRIGPLVGCLRYGKYYYRSRPAKVKQAKATKRSSNYFGLAAKAGKIMRRYLAASIPNAKDIHMQRRLEGRISKWLRWGNELPPVPTADIPFVNHFNFDAERLLQEELKAILVFKQAGTDLTELQLPSFIPANDIKAPAGTTHLELRISAVALKLGDDTCYGSYTTSMVIPYDDHVQDARQIMIPLQTQPATILVTALQLRYGVQATEISYRKFEKRSVAGIVGAVYL